MFPVPELAFEPDDPDEPDEPADPADAAATACATEPPAFPAEVLAVPAFAAVAPLLLYSDGMEVVLVAVVRIFLNDIGISLAYPVSTFLLRVIDSIAIFVYVSSVVTTVTGVFS